MKGLVYRDLIAFFRKTNKLNWVFDIVFIGVFLFAIPGAGAVPTYLLLMQPINMSGAASTLKELDTNYTGRFSLTLPVSHRQQVISRFLSSYIISGIHLAENIAFTLLHYFIKGQFGFSTYLFYLGAGIAIGVILTAVNLLSSFIASLNASIVVYLITILAAGIFYVGYWLFDLNLNVFFQLNQPQLLTVSVIAAAVVLLISYFISEKLYIKRIG